MPHQWHLVMGPGQGRRLGGLHAGLTVAHGTRWQKQWRVGEGHVYHGRFKSFPLETDDYYYQVVRYVERKALRANLVVRTQPTWTSGRPYLPR